ncbi:alpha/beta hydrolase [Cytobacillus spongiae]|jgi:pimeloyl-ACP methyl ester carboxylesterase|uniref:alpha/beta fold hydrolase n=1 Tax=Cytobacillus spongiae TaxID=2901381 RepID=UPI001F2E2687|nr:alpha/beta hydrolase [Cytobacillus spongiae]UII54198.1 alpha/beta hydrolase [Cytobacillus spongiae]
MYCEVQKGRIHYEIEGSGFPILILHAMGTDYRSMTAWIEPVFQQTKGFQRIYIDLPAHGESDITTDVKSSDDILSNIVDFIEQVIPNQSFSLIGASYGGYLAQGILCKKKNLVKSICLLAPALHIKKRTVPPKVVLYKDEEALKDLPTQIQVAIDTLLVNQTRENLELFIKEVQPGRLVANQEFLSSNWRDTGYFFTTDPFEQIETLSIPALILAGQQDSICGFEDQQILLNKLTNVTFSIIDEAGHLLAIEKRRVVQDLMTDWIERKTKGAQHEHTSYSNRI